MRVYNICPSIHRSLQLFINEDEHAGQGMILLAILALHVMPTEQRLVAVVEEVNLCTTLGIFCVVKMPLHWPIP